jgi:site-specific recombinase XerD
MRLVQRKKTKLAVYRRHTAECPGKRQGRSYTKCGCPLWVNGTHHGEPIDQSLGTRDMQEALRQVQLLEDPHTPLLKPVSEAVEAYQKHILPLEPVTQRKYANTLRRFLAYCERAGLRYLADLAVEDLDGYRLTRMLAPTTSAKELTILRLLFSFSVERRWIAENPAKKIKPPRNIKPKEVVPYEPNEITRMLAACDVVGHSDYERRRARAMLLLLRYTGLRISDVATLRRDRVQNGRIFLHTKKTGGMVFLPVPKPLEDALAQLPAPRGAGEHPRCWFWNEISSRGVVVHGAWRTLSAVFKYSGVQGAHAHKFRHTLATEILAQGHGEQDVADILGISPAVVRKHYAKWSQSRQDRITRVMRAVHAEAFGGEQDRPKERLN